MNNNNKMSFYNNDTTNCLMTFYSIIISVMFLFLFCAFVWLVWLKQEKKYNKQYNKQTNNKKPTTALGLNCCYYWVVSCHSIDFLTSCPFSCFFFFFNGYICCKYPISLLVRPVIDVLVIGHGKTLRRFDAVD